MVLCLLFLQFTELSEIRECRGSGLLDEDGKMKESALIMAE